jgi:hypothetical protein
MTEVTETRFSDSEITPGFQLADSVVDSLSSYARRADFTGEVQDPYGILKVGSILKDPKGLKYPRKLVLLIYESPEGEPMAALNYEGTIVLIGVLLCEIHQRLGDGSLFLDK